MALMQNCAISSLAPYSPTTEQPWDLERAKHLYRRIGFGATPEQLEVALELTPTELVNRLLDEVVAQPLPDEPEWAFWNYDQIVASGIVEEPFELYVSWVNRFMRRAMDNGIRERLAIFWHNHFVTSYESHNCPSYLYQYMYLLESHALGNFKEFVSDIGKTPAMLFFLNGFENNQYAPNENYARELFELFTLGINNGYSQQDIVEASRALTGFNGWTSDCGSIEFVDWGHDSGVKTIFGRTEAFGYDGLMDLIFDERGTEVAEFICGKFYTYYVNPVVNESIVADMALTFIASEFSIEMVLRELFASEHFFDSHHYAVQVKSPLDLIIITKREGGLPAFENDLEQMFWASSQLGMQLMEPTDVAGWPGNRDWIDASRLTGRWQLMDGLVWEWQSENRRVWKELAQFLVGNSNSPEVIARALTDHFISRGLLSETAYETAIEVFKWDIPQNQYDTGEWSLNTFTVPWQLVLLMRHLTRLPEFQLY